MKVEDGKPKIGEGGAMLSARPDDFDREDDIPETDPVTSGGGGISVAGCVRTTFVRLLPRYFAEKDPVRFRGASANNSQKVWVLGEEAYHDAPITEDLHLNIEDASEPPGHGHLAPSRDMLFGEYQAALADTRDDWQINEDHPDDCPVCERYGNK